MWKCRFSGMTGWIRVFLFSFFTDGVFVIYGVSGIETELFDIIEYVCFLFSFAVIRGGNINEQGIQIDMVKDKEHVCGGM